MSIVDSVAKLGATLLGIVHTRLELISVEIEEELVRLATYLVYALLALFCGGIALLLVIFLVVVLFWDNYRTEVISLLILLFGGIATGITLWLRKAWRNKPGLLQHSLAELNDDIRMFQPDRNKQG